MPYGVPGLDLGDPLPVIVKSLGMLIDKLVEGFHRGGIGAD